MANKFNEMSKKLLEAGEIRQGNETTNTERALQWMKENQDRDVSGAEAANPPKKTISSVFKDIVKYPMGDKVMAHSDRKIQDESFIEEHKKDLEHAYGGKYDVMEGDRLITMRIALEDLASGKIDAIKFEEIKEDFLLEFPDEAIDVLKKDIKEDGFTKTNLSTADKLKNKLKNFYSDAQDSAIVQMYGIRELLTLGVTKPTNKEIQAMNSIELKISKGNKNFKKKVFGGKVNMDLKESELSIKPNNPKLYDFSKVKPEMFDVHEGDRIKALIDGLKKGESDKELMKYLVDEFDPYVIQMIKNELKK